MSIGPSADGRCSTTACADEQHCAAQSRRPITGEDEGPDVRSTPGEHGAALPGATAVAQHAAAADCGNTPGRNRFCRAPGIVASGRRSGAGHSKRGAHSQHLAKLPTAARPRNRQHGIGEECARRGTAGERDRAARSARCTPAGPASGISSSSGIARCGCSRPRTDRRSRRNPPHHEALGVRGTGHRDDDAGRSHPDLCHADHEQPRPARDHRPRRSPRPANRSDSHRRDPRRLLGSPAQLEARRARCRRHHLHRAGHLGGPLRDPERKPRSGAALEWGLHHVHVPRLLGDDHAVLLQQLP